MTDINELIRRLEIMERDGSAAAIERLNTRVNRMETRLSAVEDKLQGHSTALGKIIMIVEETRGRVSEVEKGLGRVESEITSLRADLPSMLAEAVREGLKRQ